MSDDLKTSPMVTPLRCPDCGSDLSGLSTDEIFLCTSCGLCWSVGERITRVDIAISDTAGPGSLLMPFWKVEATVEVGSRLSREASSMSVIEGPREFDGSDGRLRESSRKASEATYIFPAFATSLVLSTGVGIQALVLPEIPVESGSIPPLVGGSVGMDDAAPLAKGVAVGLEVAERDFLAFVDLELTVRHTSILGVGCLPVKGYLTVGGGSEVRIPLTAITDWDVIAAWHGIRGSSAGRR